ncbi:MULTISPECIES: NlpC/P60 family protein [unclassified Dehalobacter]|uniref:C40 family peptidase n=1 Tax=unclassified Dehalobacter TaxID=2635733 RepID=UPI00028A4708|nr:MULTISPECIES: NlpC/P60 family protein [unclassified Dehalobacter]AFV01126.1 hypothetical protein DHBDCA_p98 [Dehalobacter sp. DCA]AFV04169.1 hypothetical protein DCF50_p163 [Dehalobacter sp. CF]
MKEIKIKSTIKDIKALDKVTDVSHRMKNAYIRTKDQAKQNGQNDDCNYVDNAGDRVQSGTKTITRKAGYTTGNYGKNTVRKIRKRRMGNTDASYSGALSGNQARHISKSETSNPRIEQKFVQSKAMQTSNQKAAQAQAKQAAERKIAQTVQNPVFQRVEKAAAQIGNTSGQTGRTIKRSAEVGEKTVKEAAKGTIKAVQRTVKTAEHSAKTAIKTSQSAAKSASKTAQATKRAVQAARAAARVAAVSAKTVAKSMAATIKAIIAALKSLITMITAGGWAAVVVILLVCLVGLMSGSVFGVFFSNEDISKNTPVMTETVSRLNGEFATKLDQIEKENPHDTLDLSNNDSSNMVSNWRDILAVYAVKVASDPENGIEVATLDDTKVGILRNIFWDMNKIDYWLETIEHEGTATTTDKDGNTSEETVTSTETVLHIHVTSKSYSNMIVEYNFNPQQAGMLNELMQDKYQQLFMRLIGSYTDITLSPQEIAAITQNLPEDLDEQRKNTVLAAYSLLGKVNYFWGGKSTVIGWDSRWGTLTKVTAEGSPTTGTVRPFGLDCSGYVAWVFANATENSDVADRIGFGTSSQYTACTAVSWNQAQPGDLAFYSDLSHVGIVVGKQNGELLIANCNARQNNVAVSSVSGASSSGFYTIGRPKFFGK